MLDEPTVGLDPVLRRDLWALFHRLADRGAAVLVSSHVMDEAERCDRLLLMREGVIIADGTPGRDQASSAGAADIEEAFLAIVRGRRGGMNAPDHSSPSPARVLTQLRRDHRTLAMLLVLPCLLITLLWWMFDDLPGERSTGSGPALLAMFPFIVMFLVTSVTTLRERSSGTLERLLAMPMGKLDFLLGYALAFGLVAAVQSVLAVALSVGLLGLDVAGPVWLLTVVAVADAVLGTALGLFGQRVRADRVPGGAVHAARGDPADPAVRAVRPPRRAARRARGDQRRAPAVVRRGRDADLTRRAPRPPRSGATSRSSAAFAAGGAGPRRGHAAAPYGVPRDGPAAGGSPGASRVRTWATMSLLREPLLAARRAASTVKKLVSTMPGLGGHRASYVPGETTADAVDATAALVADGLTVTLDFLGEDTLDVEQAEATVAAYLDLLRQLSASGLARHAEVSVKLSAIGQALARRRPQDRARERPRHLPGRPQRRHHGHPRHGGPHHHRLDAGDPARPAQGLPRDRRRAAGLPAPHRGRLPRAGLRGLAGPALQGRLQRARGGRLPGPRSTSTSPTCAASRCCSPARATR